ncbi:MAG: hemerythrin family protein [Nitrospirae bacterium]|nr:hemerythrin family protein [Nitrospirota bacterium]
MALIQWSDEFSVHIREIDLQHKRLFELVNEFHDAMKAGQGKMVADKLLQELNHYIRIHFAVEEHFLKKNDYPGYADQKAEHEQFAQKISEVEKRYRRNGVMLTADILFFLKNWLQGHILGGDRKYGPYLNSKGVF